MHEEVEQCRSSARSSFPEEPAEVWEALTEPERLEEWFATEVELDARPGGEGVFRWGDGDERRAVVREARSGSGSCSTGTTAAAVVIELEEVVERNAPARRRVLARVRAGVRAPRARVAPAAA